MKEEREKGKKAGREGGEKGGGDKRGRGESKKTTQKCVEPLL